MAVLHTALTRRTARAGATTGLLASPFYRCPWRSGLTIVDFSLTTELAIFARGWEVKTTSGQPLGKCVVALDVELWRFTLVPEGHTARITAYEQSVLLTGFTKSRMQDNLRTSVSEIVSDLANEILKAQGN